MNLYIRDWEVVSPLGVGKVDFVGNVQAARLNGERGEESAPRSFVFTGFDKKTYLGKKGVRNMDTLGAYATVASTMLVREHPVLGERRDRVGVALGTATGSVKSQVEFIRDLHVQEQVEWVDPIQFPQTVMNCAAGQIGIWHQYTGVNVTVSGGYHSCVTALEYAANVLEDERADYVLAGAAEEHSRYSPYLLPVDARRLRHGRRFGEGCVMFLAQRGPAPGGIEIFGLRRLAYLRRAEASRRVEDLARAVGDALRARGAAPANVRRVCFNRFSSQEVEIAHALVRHLTGAPAVDWLCADDLVGDCAAAAAGFQIALLLATAPLVAGRKGYDLALTFDPLGGAAVALIGYGNNA